MPYYPAGYPEYPSNNNGQPQGYPQARQQAPVHQYQNGGQVPYQQQQQQQQQQHPVVMVPQQRQYQQNAYHFPQSQPLQSAQFAGGHQYYYQQFPVQSGYQQQHQPVPYASSVQVSSPRPPQYTSSQPQHRQPQQDHPWVPYSQPAYAQPPLQASQHSTQQWQQQQQPSQGAPAPQAHQSSRPEWATQAPTGAAPLGALLSNSPMMNPSQSRPQAATPAKELNLPTPQRQHLAHVQIPVHRPSSADVASHEPPRSPKRRRSNDGRAVGCDNTPMPLPQGSQQKARKQGRPASSPLTELQSSQMPATPPTSVDQQAVLLALADEYLAAANGMSAMIVDQTSSDYELYCRFLTTAIGCLESALHNFRHDEARKEARLRLKLATLMFEETENSNEAQEILTKGIPVCDRANLYDSKYAMHHLSARITARDNPKAAMKVIDRVAAEVEAMALPYWTYAFRLLRVSFCLEAGTQSESANAIKNLNVITETAEELRHTGIQVVAAALETLTHVRSGNPDSTELAQRSLAAARTHQLSPEMQQMPQLQAFIETLDLAIALQCFDNSGSMAKLERMQQHMEGMSKVGTWNKDGSFNIPFDLPAQDSLESDTHGIFVRTTDGRTSLSFQWYAVNDVYSIGFIMSAFTNFLKNSSDKKAEKYLQQGLKISQSTSFTVQQGVRTLANAAAWRLELRSAMRALLVFCYASRGAWDLAEQSMTDLELENKGKLASDGKTSNNTIIHLLKYLRGALSQGKGELEEAMEYYSDPALELSKNAKISPTVKDIQALSALNKVLILRGLPDASDREEAFTLLETLDTYIRDHRNQSLHSCYNVIRATAPLSNTSSSEGGPHIIKTKQYLQAALSAAQTNKNQQLLSVIMNTMTDMFFTDIVGEQAEKSTRAGRTLANKTKDSLWIAVADGMFTRTLEQAGKIDEAKHAEIEGTRARDALPPGVKMRIGLGG